MKQSLNKQFLLFSFTLHVVGVVIVAYFQNNTSITKPFLVLGAHSRQPTHAYFRTVKTPSISSYKNYLAVRKTAEKKWLEARAARRKKAESKRRVTQMAKKESAKKVIKITKKSEPLKEKTTKKMVKNESKKGVKHAQIVEPEKKQEEVVSVQEPEDFLKVDEQEWLNFNLMGENDPKMIMFQQAIQKEVARVWHPPIGVAKGTECVYKFVVDTSGGVKDFELIERSSVLIYDLSIVRVAKNFRFEECLWGKTFVITFRQ